MCDDQGRPVRLHLTAGQVSDFKGADVLLADLPDKTEEIIGDRGYDSNRIRLLLAERTITACIPPKKNRKSKPPYGWHLYNKASPDRKHVRKAQRLATGGNTIRPLRSYLHVRNPYRCKLHLLSQRMSIRPGQVWRGSHNLSLRNRTFARMTRRRMRAVRATFACFRLSVRPR